MAWRGGAGVDLLWGSHPQLFFGLFLGLDPVGMLLGDQTLDALSKELRRLLGACAGTRGGPKEKLLVP